MVMTLVGDWTKATAITSTMVERVKRATDMATRIEAERLRVAMVTGIRKKAPGGQPFLPLADSTLRARRYRKRGGTKPLIQTGMLVGSIRVKKFPGSIYFVGVLSTAEGGRANIAEINEFGATMAVTVTPKSLRFLHAISAGEESSGGTGGLVKAPTGGGIGIMVIRIPPRPFVGPTAKTHAKPRDVKRRLETNVALLLGGQFGLPTNPIRGGNAPG